jgi:hypothetical protein
VGKAITPKTRVIAITHLSSSTGILYSAKEIAAWYGTGKGLAAISSVPMGWRRAWAGGRQARGSPGCQLDPNQLPGGNHFDECEPVANRHIGS